MNNAIDLTPFGFTPTESLVYVELLSGGPSSGYAIGKRLGIARANAYQALDGLATKGAAHVAGHRPKKYRATRPDAVLAKVVDRQSRQLDRLADQVAHSPITDSEEIVLVEGRRAISDLAMRTAARHEGTVSCLGAAEFLSSIAPAWHKRRTDNRDTRIWVIGRDEMPGMEVRGHVASEDVERLFADEVFLLAAGDAAMAACVGDEQNRGVWSTEKTIVGSVNGAIAALTSIGTEQWPGF